MLHYPTYFSELLSALLFFAAMGTEELDSTLMWKWYSIRYIIFELENELIIRKKQDGKDRINNPFCKYQLIQTKTVQPQVIS